MCSSSSNSNSSNTYVKFPSFTLLHSFTSLLISPSCLVDYRGKHLSAHTKEAIWQRIQTIHQSTSRPQQRDSCCTRKSHSLIIIWPLILQHRKAAHKQLSRSRQPRNLLPTPTRNTTIRPTNR